MDREAWQGTVHRVTKSWTQLKQLNTQCSSVHIYHIFVLHFGLPRWHSGKKSFCQAGDADSIFGLGWSPGGRNAAQSSILAWEITWTKEPSRCLNESDTTLATKQHWQNAFKIYSCSVKSVVFIMWNSYFINEFCHFIFFLFLRLFVLFLF